MNNPFEYTPDEECRNGFRRLLDWLETLKGSRRPEIATFCRELEEGKMLGILIASDSEGGQHTLYAFSGQLGSTGFLHPEFEGGLDALCPDPEDIERVCNPEAECRLGSWCPEFVGPVFDYLQPDGYFKRKEAAISRMNAKIVCFEEGEYARIRGEYLQVKLRLDAEVADYAGKCRMSKLERDAKRRSGVTDEEMEAMIRQSQFEKAELRRIKKRVEAAISPFAMAVEEAQSVLEAMKEQRRCDSEALQQWLFTNFMVPNARGESKSLSEIFAATPLKVPPSGAGECCAPKLLNAAYQRGWVPVAMAEYWYGLPKGGEVRIHGRHYPACRGKCLPVLTWMLQGLSVDPPLQDDSHSRKVWNPEILFENKWFCVVNKPSGMLSVPGKGWDVSVEEWLTERYGEGRSVKMAHRLDQDTSGLLVATFGEQPFRLMQSLFAKRMVRKTYVADLEGDYLTRGLSESDGEFRARELPRCGRIELPLSPDWLDRPRQRVDFEYGKESVTEYEFEGVSNGRIRVIFHPLTGRTHQLRVHAASAYGLGMPIVGDRLYGYPEKLSAFSETPCASPEQQASERLHLHAYRLEFTFPLDGRSYSFESPVPF